MIKFVFLFCILCTAHLGLNAQVAINSDGSSPHANAMLDVQSDSKGMLVPRLSTTQRELITSPVGLLVFDTNSNSFWFRDANGWVELVSGKLSTLVDEDGDTKIQVEESTDDDIIRFDILNFEALTLKKVGTFNPIVQLAFPSSGSDLFIGNGVGESIIESSGSTAIGDQAFVSNEFGSSNVAFGRYSLHDNDGSFNSALGSNSLRNNIADRNTGVGSKSLFENTEGENNVGLGESAGYGNQLGNNNVLIGKSAGGREAQHNKSNNVMVGYESGLNTIGSNNVFLGNQSGRNETGDQKLYIDNTATAAPLLYGEFNNNLLRVNGDLEVTGNFPGTSILEDTDNDSKLQIEKNVDEDILRLDLEGDEVLNISKSTSGSTLIQFPDNGSNTFIGNAAGELNTLGNFNSFFGKDAGGINTTGLGNTFIGSGAGNANEEGKHNTYLGYETGVGNSNGDNNTVIGTFAGSNNEGSNNTYLGFGSADATGNGNNNVYLGFETGGAAEFGSNNIFVGYQAGYNEQTDNKLYIENSDSSTPLIYGEFDNDLLRINGDLEVSGDYPGKTLIEDADGDTKIQVEESADDDIIRFEIGGEQALKIEKNTNNNARLIFAPYNTDDINIFIGDETTGSISTGDRNIGIGPKSLSNNVQGYINTGIGALTLHHNDTGVGNFAGSNAALFYNTSGYFNVGIGEAALFNNTSGFFNVGIGYSTGYRNQEGTNNVFIGSQAGEGTAFHNKSNNVMVGDQAGATNHGDANVFVGYQSGKNELGSNRLYIENSDSNEPLVYGEFDNDLLRVNGSLNINNAYTLPIADGNTTEVLQTDGSGNISWAGISSATDNQMIDLLNLNGSNLELSLENDGQAMQTVDLSSINTDNQTIDVLNLNGNMLELSMEDDGQATQTVNLSSINTDNQTIDVLNLNGNTLELSLEADAQATQTVNLSSINTDNQTIDVLNLNGNTLELSLEADGQATQTVNLSSINTDDQTIDVLNLNGTTLEISLQGDGQATQTLDLSSLVPVGVIQMWYTSTAPDGWLICDGTNIPAQYNELISLIGNQLPDLVGRFALGAGERNEGSNHPLLQTGGIEDVTLQEGNIPAHNHSVTIGFREGEEQGSGTDYSDLGASSNDHNSSRTYTTNNWGGSANGPTVAHENMPPFLTINYIIKAE